MRFLIPSLLAVSSLLPLAAADTYALDPVHSAALFSVVHADVSNTHGRFNGTSGTLTWDATDPTKSALSITIKTESVDTGEPKRDQHLRSADFFNTKQFPEMTFVAKSFTKVDEKTYTVAGDLTLMGTAKPLSVTVTKIGEGKDPWGGYRIGFESSFVLKRSEYGMKVTPGVGDDVTVTFALEGVKK